MGVRPWQGKRLRLILPRMSDQQQPVNPFDALRAALEEVRRLRVAGDIEAALARLGELEKSHAASGSLWQERGLSLQARGERAGAQAALRRAVELNDALPESWRALMGLARTAGRRSDAERAAAALAKLESLPRELFAGSSRLSEGDLDGAEA